jgi:MraZ protein
MVDGSGRVLVPPAVRTKLGIEREVMITGNIEHMEIWDRDTFAGVADGDDGITVLEGMSKLGF